MAELKSCPFCGGGAYTYTFTTYDKGIKRKQWMVHCKICGLNYPATSKKCWTEKDVVRWWNTRVSQ